QNVMERIVLMCKEDVVEVDHLPFAQNGSSDDSTIDIVSSISAPAAIESPTDHAEQQREDYSIEQLCKMIIDLVPEPKPDAQTNELFKRIEVYLAQAAVERTSGNKQAAANLLGIYRPRLYNLLKKLNASAEDSEEESAHTDAAELGKH